MQINASKEKDIRDHYFFVLVKIVKESFNGKKNENHRR